MNALEFFDYSLFHTFHITIQFFSHQFLREITILTPSFFCRKLVYVDWNSCLVAVNYKNKNILVSEGQTMSLFCCIYYSCTSLAWLLKKGKYELFLWHACRMELQHSDLPAFNQTVGIIFFFCSNGWKYYKVEYNIIKEHFPIFRSWNWGLYVFMVFIDLQGFSHSRKLAFYLWTRRCLFFVEFIC